jgi:hypothetical protein
MKNIFTGNGAVTEEGKRLLLIEFNAALENIMTSDAVSDMSESELRTLGSILAAIVADAVSFRISRRLQIATKLGMMTDQEFEVYLEEKYGSIWRFCTLTHEELARVPALSLEEFRAALKQGAEEAEACRRATGSFINTNLRFK